MKPVSIVASVITALGIVSVAPSTLAQDKPPVPQVSDRTPGGRFGEKGQLAISSDAGLAITYANVGGGGGSTVTLTLRPAADYFLIENLSLGGFVGLDYTSYDGGHSTQFAIGPRVGYNIPLSPLFSVWPKAGLSIAHTSIGSDITDGAGNKVSVSASNTALGLNLFVPFMVHPAEHFFLGFGPALDVDLTGDNKATVIAGRLTIGGWLGPL